MQYELTINLVVSLMVFCGSIFMNESPLSIIQMLWINLMQDTFASLALAT
jgi:magnesium-transporting ATPase (P-type)